MVSVADTSERYFMYTLPARRPWPLPARYRFDDLVLFDDSGKAFLFLHHGRTVRP